MSLPLIAPAEGWGAVLADELRVLGHLAGQLPIATPEPVAAGTLDSWHYILMTQLRGRRLVERWATLTQRDRDRLADELGHALAVLHRLDTSALADLPPRWSEFTSRRAVLWRASIRVNTRNRRKEVQNLLRAVSGDASAVA